MAIVSTKINRWDGGITNDLRDPATNVARVISNFDILKNVKKMTPYRSTEDGDASSDAQRIRNFTIALRTGTTYSIYGFGRTSAASTVGKVYYKDITTGAANDLDDSDWTGTNNNASGVTTQNYNLFVYYPRTDLIYMARGSSQIMAYDPGGGAVWNDSHQALTYTQIGQGIVHSKDDILYIPYYNNGGFIARNNNGTWNNTALTLPIHYVPTSICEYGNYLAIACANTNGIENSRVFLWDRDSSLTTVSESIDWGNGSLIILEEVDGELIGISQRGGSAGSFTGFPINISYITARVNATTGDSVIFRKLVGNRGVRFFELHANHASGAATTELPLYKQKVGNRLYFQMQVELNGSSRDGIWSIGRSSPDAPFALIHEQSTNNDTALVDGDTLNGFIIFGDYRFQSYLVNSTTVQFMTKTVANGSTFSHNSVYETKRFDGSIHGYDASYYKDLVEVTVDTEYMPTAGQITLQYRVNQNTAWNTIFVHSTDNSISHSAINFEGRTATMTIASPAVVTLTAHGLVANDRIYFTTTGALPTGVTANTVYYVISTGLAADSFRFSTTEGGSAVNTSGTQSGTHTLNRSDAALSKDYKEIEFRIVATGGAEVTGLVFKENIKIRRYDTALVDAN